MDDPALRVQCLERFNALINSDHEQAKYLMLRILVQEKTFNPLEGCPLAIDLGLCDATSIHTNTGVCVPIRFGIDGDGRVKKREDFGLTLQEIEKKRAKSK